MTPRNRKVASGPNIGTFVCSVHKSRNMGYCSQCGAEVFAAAREQALSEACPVDGCEADERRLGSPFAECIPVDGESFEYGVHVARARAAGLPPWPTIADLKRGVGFGREEQPCHDRKGDGSGAWGMEPCGTCDGAGKLIRFVWKRPVSARTARIRAQQASSDGSGAIIIARCPSLDKPKRDR